MSDILKCEVNDIELAYTKSGNGEPLILLHGNGEDHTIFDKLIELYSSDFTVYAIDTRGHGESGGKEASYEIFASDLEEFIKSLNLVNPSVIGFSDGGITALISAINGVNFKKMAILGANIFPKGLKRSVRFMYKLAYSLSHDERINMMLKEPDISPEELNRIHSEILILAGEKDMIAKKHTELIHDNIPNSTLNVLEGENHSSYVFDNEKLYSFTKDFMLE